MRTGTLLGFGFRFLRPRRGRFVRGIGRVGVGPLRFQESRALFFFLVANLRPNERDNERAQQDRGNQTARETRHCSRAYQSLRLVQADWAAPLSWPALAR